MVDVSVISTVYNGAKHFSRITPSILGQTFGDFEWVIVDDGSDDSTPDLLTKLARQDSRIVVVSPGRIGRSTALNHAVEAARGAYIVQQDFDDLSYAGRVGRQVQYLLDHPEIGLLGSHYILVDEIRGERYVRRPPVEHEAIVRAMASNIPFAHTMVAFRKDAWHQAGKYPSAEALIDFRLFIEIARCGWKLGNLPEILGEHFVYSQSYWHRNYRYTQKQRELAGLQLHAIRTLGMPWWTIAYPAGRLIYQHLPASGKRIVRRRLAGSNEQDL
ncbi:MAG: glycosyltransferase [Pseudomonadota bacterium]